MTELQQGMKMLGSLPRNLITQFPSGRWGFVGSVNAQLIYQRKDGQPLTDKDCQDIASFGPGLLRHIESLSWATAQEAEQAAKDLGFEISPVKNKE